MAIDADGKFYIGGRLRRSEVTRRRGGALARLALRPGRLGELAFFLWSVRSQHQRARAQARLERQTARLHHVVGDRRLSDRLLEELEREAAEGPAPYEALLDDLIDKWIRRPQR